MKGSRWRKLFLLALPAVAGVTGFLLDRSCSFLDAVFRCVTMYVLNYGDTPPNALVELARWTAPLATASGILMAAASLNQRLRNWLLYRFRDTVAVYGPDEDCSRALKELGKSGVRGGESLVKAHRYILLGSEEENLSFCDKYRDRLGERMIYMRSDSLPVQASLDSRIKFFSAEETAARLFWKRCCLYAAAEKNAFQLNIALIGFGRLGEELLFWGLQDNLFSPDQKICYHVFGDCKRMIAVHRSLGAVSDPVLYHEAPWFEELKLLKQADLIVVLEQRNQTELLQNLRFAMPEAEISVFIAQSAAAELLAKSYGLDVFDWQHEAFAVQNILEDRLYRLAKSINLRYSHLFNGTAETKENLETEWNRLDAFTRCSNISSADYHEIRLKMLEHLGLQPRIEAIPPETLELLAELEHIRWCRYHYLMNWSYGIPENGAAKDPAKRIHADLVDYRDLSEAEKEKDRENIRVLLSL